MFFFSSIIFRETSDYLTSINFDMKTGIEIPEEVVKKTLDKYVEVFKILTGRNPVL